MTLDNTNTDSASQANNSTLESKLPDAIAQADGVVADRVQQLQWIHQARSARLSRTAGDLNARYGADDIGVKRAEAALAASQMISARLGIAHRQITTAEPDVAANGWALHGRVYDANGKPVPRLTVFLADALRAYQSAYGYAYTDDTGYFLLKYDGGKGADRETAASERQDKAPLFVEVSDLSRRTMYSSPTALERVTGSATYLNIVLSAGEVPLGEPPAGTGKGPPRKGKSKG